MPEFLRPALVITFREVRDQFRDWRIIFPIVGLTLVFPFLMNFTTQEILNFVGKYGATIIGERLVPFSLLIVGFFPSTVSLVIALESFVGEKERGSIEPLLNTPLHDWQLYLGKLLSSTVPPLFASFLGMLVYLLGLTITHVPWPEPVLLLQIITLTIVQAFVMVSGAVVLSSQATSVRAANLLASLIILPVAFLIQGESVVMFWGNFDTLWVALFGLIVLAILLVRVGLAHFQREELLGREIDVLNLRWGWRIFWGAFTGQARSIREWYFKSLPGTIRSLWMPVLIVTVLCVAGVIIGTTQVDRFRIPLTETTLDGMDDRLRSMIEMWPLFDLRPVLAIWWQNTRVLILAMLLGAISFGILGVIPIFTTMGIIGYLYGLLNQIGLPVLSYWGLLLPHGLLEIPVAILASAAVLRAGAVLAAPTPDKTVGEVWLSSLGEWMKIMVGVVLPLLFIAAVLEAWVTPRLALLFL